MRKQIATAVLAAAVSAIFGLTSQTLAQSARGNPPAENIAAAPVAAEAQAQIPVRQVVLYSSGVGYFEHFGTVKGNGATELRFKAAQINDILKSLVLQDMDKGKVGVITYPSQDPIAKTLRSFQVDITSNPSMADLLNQLRGAKVTVTSGAEKVAGTVLGVEHKSRPIGTGEGARVVDLSYLNLVTPTGIRSVALDDVRTFEIEDKKLQDEMTRALSALASARDQDKKPVSINFTGDGERRLRIGYVVETPVWKTSYRLVLTDKLDKPAEAPKLGAAAKPDAKKAEGALQGWAIVENQTDNDWTDVQLTLVSGRPISFIQDLYQPLYIPRPTVQPELYASLRPQTYDDAISNALPQQRFKQLAGAAAPPPAPMAAAPAKPGSRRLEEAAKGSDRLERMEQQQSEKRQSLAAMDVSESVSSLASASKVGELFQYTVGNVSLPRQTSAMIPVVTDPVEAEKLSIYNMNVLAKNPLLGARVKNTTGKHLLQGPVTVLDGGSYAGDARIDDLPPGQERLISYGVDQQILVQAQNNHQENAVQTGKIVKGVLQLTRKLVATQDYVAENKGEKDKTLVIEHARRGGGWKLVEPAKAEETTDTLYRFKGGVSAGKGTKLTVREEIVTTERLALLNIDDGSLELYNRTGEIPQDVRDALAKAVTFRQAVADTQSKIRDRQQQVNTISQEQTRLRENMKTVAQNTDYYTRLLKKLDEQETQIEKLQKEITGLQKQADDQRKALQEYIRGLNVG